MEKSHAIKILRGLADTLEKEGVRLRDNSYVNIHAGIEEGVSSDGWNTAAYNGEKSFDIKISYYDPYSDKSHEAHISS